MVDIIGSRQIVLASRSPRRKELMDLMGLAFDVVVPDVDETPNANEGPSELAARLSLAKASEVARVFSRSVIVAADTMVVLDGAILGKPASPDAAHDMLDRLRDRCHYVYSGLAVLDGENKRQVVQTVVTPVYMRDYAPSDVQRYVASGDPMDKAGAYAIQHTEFEPVEKLAGCYTNVMGLPVCHLYRVLEDWSVSVSVHPLEGCPLARRRPCPWAAAILDGVEDIDTENASNAGATVAL